MKTKDNWWLSIETVGVVALIVSLLFVGYQLQQDRRIATAQVIAENNASTIELFATISENSDVWRKALSGDQLSQDDEMQFKAIAFGIYQRHYNLFQVIGQLDVGSREQVAQQYAFDLYQYPALRRLFIAEGQLIDARNRFFERPGGSGFRAVVTEQLNRLDEAGQEFPEKTNFPY